MRRLFLLALTVVGLFRAFRTERQLCVRVRIKRQDCLESLETSFFHSLGMLLIDFQDPHIN